MMTLYHAWSRPLEGRMNEYRVYLLNSENHIRGAQNLTAPDESAALRAAFKIAAGGAAEVWQSTRLIARIDRSGEVAR